MYKHRSYFPLTGINVCLLNTYLNTFFLSTTKITSSETVQLNLLATSFQFISHQIECNIEIIFLKKKNMNVKYP